MDRLKEKLDEVMWDIINMKESISKLTQENNYLKSKLIEVNNYVSKIKMDKKFFAEINQDTENEKKKYLSIYMGELDEWLKTNSNKDFKDYGCENHGSGIIEYLQKTGAESLIDIGCGNGSFCVEAKQFIKKVYGLDIASVEAGKVINDKGIIYFNNEAWAIPCDNKSIDIITGFDVLEHIPEVYLERTLKELDRICKRMMIFSISYDRCEYQGEIFHKIVMPPEWWTEKLNKLGRLIRFGKTPYTGDRYYIIFKEGFDGN